MPAYDVLIVGAGHAGAQCAVALRQGGFQGSISLVTEEADPPYERPPLSKDYLAGEKVFERILIRPASFWAERRVELIAGCRVAAIDPHARTVATAAGESIGYGSLVWAAGGSARRLACEGAGLAGIHTIRTRADVDLLRSELPGVERVAIVGGGYIGLEAAAVLVKLGKQVVVLEAQGRVLARVAGEPLSRFYESEHRAHGVDLRCGALVDCILGENGRVSAVRLAGGEEIPAQMVVAGIGIVPEVAPLLAAGAEGGNGVAVDAQCRTSVPGVFAIGDCALHSSRFAGGAMIRLESVQNAHDQATVAAKILLGQDEQYDAVPWFWSAQYDLRLQTIGISTGYDALVLRGDAAMRSFALVYLKQGRVIALDCVNATKDYVQGRRLVAEGLVVDVAALADSRIALKEIAEVGSIPDAR